MSATRAPRSSSSSTVARPMPVAPPETTTTRPAKSIHPSIRKGRSGSATECYMPPGARIDPHWSYRGLPAVRMENRWMAVEVLPDTGAKIFRLIDKAADRNVLWENTRIPPHRAPVFASMDDHWSGGWDEIFPGGAPSTDRYGEGPPYMGGPWAEVAGQWRPPRRAGAVLFAPPAGCARPAAATPR